MTFFFLFPSKMNAQGAIQAAKGLAGPAIRSVGAGAVAAAGGAIALPALGFGTAGVKAGSAAALVQSCWYGAVVPAGSWFATATSWGATGAMTTSFATVAAPVGVVAYLYARRK